MNRITFTPKQKELLTLLKNPNLNQVFALGGSRSGKSHAITEYSVRQCFHHPGLRILIARQFLSHAKASIWGETIKKVLRSYSKLYEDPLFTINDTSLCVTFKNGSEIHVAGLDDNERLEKILGREFGIIFLNECSQISYDAVKICKTRLAQNIDGFRNKMIYDANPPAPTHWLHKICIEGIEPDTGNPIDMKEIGVTFINPKDNIDNLNADYIKTLESLPDRERRRFLLGEFVKMQGAIYDSFSLEDNVIQYEQVPNIEYFTVGIDSTGNNLAAVLIGWAGDNIYLLDEYAAFRMPITDFASTIYSKWGIYGYIGYADPAAGALNNYFQNVIPADNSVAPGIDYIRTKIEYKQLFMVKKDGRIKTPKLLEEMDSYRYDDKGRIVKENDHLCTDGDTLITVPGGYKKISEIQVGDFVLTTDETFHAVEQVFVSEKETVESLFSDGRKIISTPDHRFITPQGYIEQRHCIYPIYRRKQCIKYTMESSSGKQKVDIGLGSEILKKSLGPVEHILSYGLQIMVQSLMDIKSIIRILIETIMTFLTLPVWKKLFITPFMNKVRKLKNGIKNGIGKVLKHLEDSDKNILMKLISNIVKQARKLGRRSEKEESSSTSVQHAEESLNHTWKDQSNIAQSNARMTVQEPDKHDLITIIDSKPTGKRKVYSLQIEGCYTYYTNDVATKNCDAMRYGIYSHALFGASILR